MDRKIAVAVIHGMGGQAVPAGDAPSFSRRMRAAVRAEYGGARFDADVAWREIYWADILEPREAAYLARARAHLGWRWLRRFVVSNLSDAASYRQVPQGSPEQTYAQVHARVDAALEALEGEVEHGAPLVVLAHSLGGHIISNHIWDIAKPGSAAPTPFRNMETLGGFFTYGCNIPIFVFAHDPAEVAPVTFPGLVPERLKDEPWWWNFFDRQDVLGYPLGAIGARYAASVRAGEIADVQVRAGGFLSGFTPLSHTGYWQSRAVVRRIAGRMQALVEG